MEATASTSQPRDWSSLPTDVLLLILGTLRWSSHPSVALVCQQWRYAVSLSPFYPVWITPLLLNTTDVGTTNIRYYSPYCDKNFEVDDTLKVPGAKICCSTGRHLKMRVDKSSVFDINLVSGVLVEVLPQSPYALFNFVVSDHDERLFGIEAMFTIEVASAIRTNSDEWEDWNLAENSPDWSQLQASPGTNPVLHNSLLYLLAQDGRLAVYDPCRHHEGFKILDKPNSFGFKCEDSYLLESNQGELMVVAIERRGKKVHLVKLNEQSMEWEKVDSLHSQTVFTGSLTTMMKKTKFNWMQNMIFLPRFYQWPETVHVDLVARDGELAFVPKLPFCADMYLDTCGTNIWSYELAHEAATKEFWGTERADYSIWVDFGVIDCTYNPHYLEK
uniref:F-box domain-containing protein n=1 Tax=Oryza nivara TaxID=4536 RepID=A0A0E0IIR7_ORYNI